jgi:DNA polymerase-3 subunit beta
VKIDCSRRELNEALTTAGMATGSRSPITIYQNLRFEAADNKLRILGCDGEMWVEREITCTVHSPGSVLVNSRLIQDLVGTLPEGDVHLEWDNTQLVLDTDGSRYQLLGQAVGDFPDLPKIATASTLSLSMAEFRHTVDCVSFAVAQDIHRQVLTGVLFSYNNNVLTLVATDTHRLAVVKLEREGIGSDMSVVIPDKAIRAMKAIPVVDTTQIEIHFSEKQLAVAVEGVRIVSQILDGQFPNWERVVPSETNRHWDVEKASLESKLRRALIIAKDVNFRVKFQGTGDNLEISARGDQGDANEKLLIISDNGDIPIAFNGRYVLEAVGPIQGDTVRIKMSESSRAAVFGSSDPQETYFCVIMPMALI